MASFILVTLADSPHGKPKPRLIGLSSVRRIDPTAAGRALIVQDDSTETETAETFERVCLALGVNIGGVGL
jgi:hypothetical protein